MSKIEKPELKTKTLEDLLARLQHGANWSEIKVDDVTGYTDKLEIFQALFMRVDKYVESEVTHHIFAESPRDRLFEILMMRFDALNEYGDAYRHLFYQVFKDPTLFRTALPQFHASIDVMLRLADLNGRDGSGILPLRTGAIALVYLNAVRIWLNDYTDDMAKTMAELDRGLSRLDKVMDFIPTPLKDFI